MVHDQDDQIPKSRVENHPHQLGYTSRFNVWIPHHLNEINLTQQISICKSLQKYEEENHFLKEMLTGDKKTMDQFIIIWSVVNHNNNLQSRTSPEACYASNLVGRGGYCPFGASSHRYHHHHLSSTFHGLDRIINLNLGLASI